MLTKEDLEQIRTIIDERVTKILDEGMVKLVDKRMTKLEGQYSYILVELIGLHKEAKKMQKDIRKLSNDLKITQRGFDREILETVKRVDMLESYLIRDANIDSST